MIPKFKVLIYCFLLCVFIQTQAQSYETKLILSKGVSLRINNFNISYSNITSTNHLGNNQAIRLTFLEHTIGFNYFFKNIKIGISHNPILIVRSNNPNYWKHRFQFNSAIRNEIGKIRLINSLAFEYFTRQEIKYRARIIYTIRTQVRKRKKISTNLKIAPYVAFRIYYNMGGNPIKQYQLSSEIIDEKIPYGLHRARVYLGISSRIKSICYLNIYTLFQQEFNTYFSKNHAINTVNPENGKIYRPFINYIAFGISFRYTFRLKTKAKKEFDPEMNN